MVNAIVRAICSLIDKIEALISILTPPSGNASSSISPISRRSDGRAIRLVNTNPQRLGVVVQNQSESELMIALDSDRCDENYYTFRLRAGETLHFDMRMFKETYKGAMMGKWEDGANEQSKALVTEVFW